MPSLNSSFLAWVEYNAGTMHLTFRNGRVYVLRGVPEFHYQGLLAAASPGSYFNRHLKGRY